MVVDKTISGKIAEGSPGHRLDRRRRPAAGRSEQRGMKQVTDTGAIDAAIEAVIAANPDKVEEVKAKPKLAAWFVGQVMKQTGGKANPTAVNAALKTRLNLPDEGVIRTKCAFRGSVPQNPQIFVRTRNKHFNPFEMGVSCISCFFHFFQIPHRVAFQNASTSY
jgi:hypothetical protein